MGCCRYEVEDKDSSGVLSDHSSMTVVAGPKEDRRSRRLRAKYEAPELRLRENWYQTLE